MVIELRAAPSRRAVFLDRDGVLVIPTFGNGRSYAPTSLDQFAIYQDSAPSLARLKAAGFLLVVVTNQPDVGAGRVAGDVVEEMHRRLRRDLPLDDIKVCLHTQDANCRCRKPRPDMLLEAAAALMINLADSMMVGDRASDVEAGRAAGCRTVYIDRGYTAEAPPGCVDFTATSLTNAADWILRVGISSDDNPSAT
jgi:D-glycero-D-manno-heptose 1,7-bisphosphate phosphatase